MNEPPPGTDGDTATLQGIRVIDCATLFAGPTVATLLGDFGADVIKVEHPRGDSLRGLGWSKDGHSLWWLLTSRNKRPVTLDLSTDPGRDVMLELASTADVLIENFRPGVMERWGLAPAVLHDTNPGLIVVRATGFGQTGPYAQRPGFGTLAEAMSGFAHINGHPDGPPTLPPFALGDGVAGLFGAVATLAALHERARSGRGQIIDLSIYEPLFSLLGPQAVVYDQLGIVQQRTGNRAPFTAPRNAYRTRDGRWVALSASARSVAERVMHIVGRPDLIDEPWFATHRGRLNHQDELDTIIGGWIAQRDADEVTAAFEEGDAAIAPVYSVADTFDDPQYRARETITTVVHPDLGPIRVPNVFPKMSRTPGGIRRLGGPLGEANDEIYVGELGHTTDELDRWRADGIV